MNCKPYIRAHADELLESLAALVRIPSVKACRKSMRRSAVSLPVRCTKRLRSAKSWASGPAIWTTASAGASTARARKWWLCSVIWTLCPPATAGLRPSRFPAKSKTAVFTDAARWIDKGPMVAAIYALAALRDAGFAPLQAHPSAVRHQRGDRLRRYVVVRFAWRRAAGVRLHAGRRIPDHQRRKGHSQRHLQPKAAPDRRLPPDKVRGRCRLQHLLRRMRRRSCSVRRTRLPKSRRTR